MVGHMGGGFPWCGGSPSLSSFVGAGGVVRLGLGNPRLRFVAGVCVKTNIHRLSTSVHSLSTSGGQRPSVPASRRLHNFEIVWIAGRGARGPSESTNRQTPLRLMGTYTHEPDRARTSTQSPSLLELPRAGHPQGVEEPCRPSKNANSSSSYPVSACTPAGTQLSVAALLAVAGIIWGVSAATKAGADRLEVAAETTVISVEALRGPLTPSVSLPSTKYEKLAVDSPEALRDALSDSDYDRSSINDVLVDEYAWMERSEGVKALQERLGVETDGVYGLETRTAHAAELAAFGLYHPPLPEVVIYTPPEGIAATPTSG